MALIIGGEPLTEKASKAKKLEEERLEIDNLRQESEIKVDSSDSKKYVNLLIVEDTACHRDDAAVVISAIAQKRKINLNIFIVATADRAGKMMEERGIQYIISDVYLPLSNKSPYNHAESPCGLNVVASARKLDIPIVMCTMGNHHGAKLEWLLELEYCGVIPKMISGTDSTDSAKKNWGQAFRYLNVHL